MKKDLMAVIVISIIVTIVMIPIVLGSKKISAAAAKCEADGGVHVRTYDGFACILRTKP